MRGEALEDRRLLAAVGYQGFLNASTDIGYEDYIQEAGHTPQKVTDIATFDFNTIDALVLDVAGRSSTLIASYANVENFVDGGGLLIIHDWSPSHQGTFDIVPGINTASFHYGGSRNLDVSDPTSPIISGPFGTVNDSTLDGGSWAAHGFVDATTLPAGVDQFLHHDGDINRAAAITYEFGAGRVVYSTIPAECYVVGGGCENIDPFATNLRNIYLRNELVAFLDANAPPEAQNDFYQVDEDNTLTVNAANGVLDNDSDPDGDSLTATIVTTAPSNGTVTLNVDGSFEYVPDPNFNGIDTFAYEVSDGNGGTDTATVEITVHSVIDAQIDVKPGSDVNPLNLSSKGVVPIAILSTQQANGAIDDFDAQTLDPNSATFFLNGVEIDPVHAAFEDVDGDGDLDLLLHFSMEDLVNEGIVDEDSTDLALTAEYGGAALGHDLGGSDSVRTIVPKGKGNGNGNGNGKGN